MRAEVQIVHDEFATWKEARLERLETELAQMEEGGAKSQEITARRKEVEREMRDRGERAQRGRAHRGRLTPSAR